MPSARHILLRLLVACASCWLADARAAGPLPPEVDLRPVLKAWNLGTREQGDRPTCSVFAFTGGLEFALARARGKGERLSVDYVNWAANQERERPRDGGFFSEMWAGFARHGVCTEEEMNYGMKFDVTRQPDPGARTSARAISQLGLTRHWIKKWNPKTGLSDGEFESIRRTLNSGWPVCGGFRWPKRATWKNGVLEMRAADEVFDGHSVLLTGYRDDGAQAGEGVFLIRDSGSGEDRAMPYAYAKTFMNDALRIGVRSAVPLTSGR